MRATLPVTVLSLGLLLAACGTAPTTVPSAGRRGSSGSTAVPLGVTPSGTTRPSAGCGPRVLVPATRSEHACVRAGHTVLVRSSERPAARYLRNWTPVVSSATSVIACHGTSYPNGSVTATCRALRAGTATLTSALVYAPGGPPEGRNPPGWRAVVTVVP